MKRKNTKENSKKLVKPMVSCQVKNVIEYIYFFKYCTKIRVKYVKFVFTDAKKRSRYDSGVDLEDLEGHGHGFGGDIDPNQVFQAFFGGGAGRCCGRTMYC